MKKRNFVKGALILSVGAIVCKLIGAFYRLPLSNIIGAEGIGVYQLVFPLYALAIVLLCGGVPMAETKLVAQYSARGDYKSCKKLLIQTSVLMIVAGFFITLIMFLLSGVLSYAVGNMSTKLPFMIVSCGVFFAGMTSAFRGYFQGLENMVPTMVSQIIEQAVKMALGLYFALLLMPMGATYGVAGAMLGVLCSEVLALIYIFITFVCHKKSLNSSIKKQKFYTPDKTFEKLLKLSLPFLLCSIMMPIMSAVDSLLIVNLLKSSGITNINATSMFGLYSGVVGSLINFPVAVCSALGVALLPAISYSFKLNEEDCKRKISLALKLVFAFCIPCIMGFWLLTPEIISLIYPSLKLQDYNLFVLACALLRIGAINILFVSFMQVSTSILQGIGKMLIPVASLSLALFIKVIMIFALTPNPDLNIIGASVAGILAYFVACFINLAYLRECGLYELNNNDFYIISISTILLGIIAGMLKAPLANYVGVFAQVAIIVFFVALVYCFVLVRTKVVVLAQLKGNLGKRSKNQ